MADMRIREKEECLSLTRQQNTEKLHVLTVLEEQKNKLTSSAQNRKIRHVEDCLQKVAEYAADCEKLSQLLKQLNEQADILKREIKLLQLKTRPHPLPAAQQEKKMFEPFSPAAKNEKKKYLDKKGNTEVTDFQVQNDQETESDKSFTEEEEKEGEREGKEDHHMGVQNLLENVLKRFTVPKKDKQSTTEHSKEIKNSEGVEDSTDVTDNNIRQCMHDLLPAIISEVGQLDISLGLTVIDDIIDKLSFRLELQEDTDNIRYTLNQIIIDLSSKDVSNPGLAISETIQDLETKEEHDDITEVKLILYHIIKDTMTVIAEEDFRSNNINYT
ncbi:uncharacterized protein LOC126278879 [Schistocerca gregaria]|uniref:uncharacterized protein LOC126278879 n=1 Tax=Schistocerca gregaria TaxID=7010 RepID=UPI00211EF547|nr:uncharacterized protein LOC126278879 [Schistocerca gregaria]